MIERVRTHLKFPTTTTWVLAVRRQLHTCQKWAIWALSHTIIRRLSISLCHPCLKGHKDLTVSMSILKGAFERRTVALHRRQYCGAGTGGYAAIRSLRCCETEPMWLVMGNVTFLILVCYIPYLVCFSHKNVVFIESNIYIYY